MQVFRLMGMPDKVIAFDELPKRLLEGFELCRAEGFPRHWKTWLGKIEKITKIPPERDPFTNQIRKFEPVIEQDSFFYLVDWQIGPIVEKWKEVCDFVRQHVDKEVRLKERLEDMALPLAANKTDGVTLEPEDVPIIPIPIEFQENDGVVIKNQAPAEFFRCDEEGCKAEFDDKRAMRMHTMRKHQKTAQTV